MSGKFKVKPDAVKERLIGLSGLSTDVFRAFANKGADRLIRNYKQGIKRDALGLRPLSGETIEAKQKKGMPQPSTPLYGHGARDDKSLFNALIKRRIKNGIQVEARKALHQASRIPLDVMLALHAKGFSFTSPSGRMIHVPPRPALRVAIDITLQEQSLKTDSQKIKREISKFISTGDRAGLRRMTKALT